MNTYSFSALSEYSTLYDWTTIENARIKGETKNQISSDDIFANSYSTEKVQGSLIVTEHSYDEGLSKIEGFIFSSSQNNANAILNEWQKEYSQIIFPKKMCEKSKEFHAKIMTEKKDKFLSGVRNFKTTGIEHDEYPILIKEIASYLEYDEYDSENEMFFDVEDSLTRLAMICLIMCEVCYQHKHNYDRLFMDAICEFQYQVFSQQ